MSVYEETPFFRLREFKKKDFYRLTEIARAINRKALRCQKQGYFPFYAFQVDQTVSDVDTILRQKVQFFLEKAQKERSVWPRSTYRLAVENQKGDLIGNVTVDMLPILEDGKIIYGDLGYFVDPRAAGRGIMTQAVCQVLRYYFKNNERLDITAHPDNVYSSRLIERIGGKAVGFVQQSHYQNEPRRVFVVLKKDFEKALLHLERLHKIRSHSVCFRTHICQNQR